MAHEMRFLLDNWLPVRHMAALNALFQSEHDFAHARLTFGPNAKDAESVAALRQEPDRIIISGDYRVATIPHLGRSWQQAGLTTFFLTRDWMKLPLLQQNANLAAMVGKFVERVNTAQPGSGFSVSVTGRVEQLYQASSTVSPG